MKKCILFTLAIFVILLFFAGCGLTEPGALKKAVNIKGNVTEQAANRNDKAQSPFIGSKDEDYYMISFLSGLDYWKGCFSGFKDAANQFGVRAVYVGDSGYDVNKSIEVLDQVIARKPEGIAIACIDSYALNESIKKALNAGIKVVTYDSDAPESGRITFVATGNRAAGAGAARHLAGLIGGTGEVAVLYSVGLPCAQERLDGFKECIKSEYPGIKLAASADDKGDQFEAVKAIREVLDKNKNINGIFCVDGIAGVSAATVVKELNKQGQIHIIGFDCDKALLDLVGNGAVDATIAQGTYSMGYWAMNVLYHSAHDMSAERYPVFIDTGFEIVTKDTVKPYYTRYMQK